MSPSSKIFDILGRIFVWVFNREPEEFTVLRKIKYFIASGYKGRVPKSHFKIIKKYVKKGDICIDVGANRGDYTKAFLKQGAFVVAFEPSTMIRTLYEKVGHKKGVTIFGFALGRNCESIRLSEFADDGSTTATTNKGSHSVIYQHVVPCNILDDIRCTPDFIKIDTQGMDYEVLLGAEETLKRCKPIVLAEYEPDLLAERGYTISDMIKYMSGLGYRFETVKIYDVAGDILFIPEGK